MKIYSRDELAKMYNAMTKDKKIAVLYSAIDFMQQYNGRARQHCIFLAMGFNDIIGNGDYTKNS